MSHYLIAYDISNIKRRDAVRKLLYDFAVKSQKSVLEANLSQKELAYLIKALLAITKKQDKINIIKFKQCTLLHQPGFLSFNDHYIFI